mgnify:CR=1 FL=1
MLRLDPDDFALVDERLMVRPETPGDLDFLERLYATTRADELALAGWNRAQQAAFIHQQFTAQHAHYRKHFPDAGFWLLELDGGRAGRLYLHPRSDEIRLIDIALLPEWRGRGIGGALLRRLLERAGAAGLPVRLHVEPDNPAARLYGRLGFCGVEDRGVYRFMEWLPKPADSGLR